MRYLIIGGGVAGWTAAEEIRKRDPEGEVTLVSEELHPLYSRVLLPHYLKEKTPRERVFLKKPEWHQEKNIEVFSGVRVEAIDVKNRFVRTSEARELPFDKLLITTGGELRLIDSDMRGVVYLRTIDDADHILNLASEMKTLPESGRRVAVYGAGFIALEFLNFFKHIGFHSTLIMRGQGFWSSTLSPASQNVLHAHAVREGVEIFRDERAIELKGERELEGVQLQDGTVLPVRMLGVGIGIETDKALFTEAGIEVRDGVLTNEYFETAIEGVFAAGDVAEFDDLTVGRKVRYGNWMNAQMQARAVAKTMTSERAPFELVSSYATNLLGKEIVFIGDVSREHADAVRQYVVDEENAIELFERGGRTVGAVLIGDVSKRQAITNAIKSKQLFV